MPGISAHKVIKRFIGIALVCLCFAAQAWAEDFEVANDDGILIKYLVTATGAGPGENTVAVVARTPKYSGVVNIPATVTHDGVTYNVTSIGGGYVTPSGSAPGAFQGCSGLTSVTFPNTITSIGDYAFTSCISLTSIIFPNSVTEIGAYAFMECSYLASVTMSESVTDIGWQSFAYCSSLASITIPALVTEIGDNAFAGCSSLTAITVTTGNPSYTAEEGVLFNVSKTNLIQYPAGKTGTTYEIPGTVTFIAGSAFYGCNRLTSITIPNSVTTIAYHAFHGCSKLTAITIPSSVTEIGDLAFGGSFIPVTVEVEWETPIEIPGLGFDYINCTLIVPVGTLEAYKDATNWNRFGTIMEEDATPLTVEPTSLSFDAYGPEDITVTVTDGGTWSVAANADWLTVTKDEGEDTFTVTAEDNEDEEREALITISNSSMTKSIPALQSAASFVQGGITYTVLYGTTVAASSAEGTLSGAITIPGTVTAGTTTYDVTRVGEYAFYGCSGITSIIISFGITYIEEAAFGSCTNLASIDIPESVTYIGVVAFADCSSLTSVAIPSKVEFIGESAFHNCSSLISVTIPGSVSEMGDDVFSGSTNLISLEVEWSSPLYLSYSIVGDDNYSSCTLIVPVGTLEAYKAAAIWKQFGTIVEKGVTPLTVEPTSLSFEAYGSTTQTVTVTGSDEWDITDDAEWLTAEKVAGNTTFTVTAEDNPGGAREARITVSKEGTVRFIQASQSAASFEVDEILYTALTNNTVAVTKKTGGYSGAITIPSTVTPTGGTTYNVTSIGDSAFYNCSGLTSISILAGVTRIGAYAFVSCSSLTSIIIPNSVTSVRNYAFAYCSSLTSITIPSSVTSVGWSILYGCSNLTSIEVEWETPLAVSNSVLQGRNAKICLCRQGGTEVGK